MSEHIDRLVERYVSDNEGHKVAAATQHRPTTTVNTLTRKKKKNERDSQEAAGKV